MLTKNSFSTFAYQTEHMHVSPKTKEWTSLLLLHCYCDELFSPALQNEETLKTTIKTLQDKLKESEDKTVKVKACAEEKIAEWVFLSTVSTYEHSNYELFYIRVRLSSSSKVVCEDCLQF